MPVVRTEDLQPGMLSPSDTLQVYCGLDNCVTLEVREELGEPPAIYQFERALQGPYLEMILRGFAIDELARRHAASALRERIARLTVTLNELASAMWDRGLNPRSPQQLRQFFYSAMRLPEQWISQKGERKLSMNREVLEKLEVYLHARPVISCILAIRDLSKQLEVLETDIDSDGRFRTSYNIAGTETGRPSSSSNAYGTGGNAQNIAPALRYVFVADPGKKLAVIDLEQVEARDVGFICGCLFGDWSFLDNCESGDLHTNNAKLIWRELPWTGERKVDRQIADRLFYRDFSFRDMSKRGGHLCLTPDHEVLTSYGWVPITEKPIQIMAWSENGSQFETVERWTDEDFSGGLVMFEGNSISLCMTENHRVPFKSDQRNAGPIQVRRAIDGPGNHMPLGWGYEGGDEKVPARLIAAFMSDGTQASTNRMHFHLLKRRKIDRLIELCKQYGFTYEWDEKYSTMSVHGSLPKRAGAYMFQWNKECIEDFIDEYKHWDGHISETAVALFSVDKEHLEWIQTFGRLVGIGGSISQSTVTSTFSGSSRVYTTKYYRLQQNHRRWATGKSVKCKVFCMEGIRVLCPTVPSQFFYVRRAGKICVTGNSNYMGTAWTASRHLKVPLSIMDEFQARYVRGRAADPRRGLPAITPAFPCIARYWDWVAQQLQTTNQLTTPFGRRRHFFGRPGDAATVREGIAFLPQSTTADRTNLGLWRVWRYMPQVQLLAQTYDSITFQYDESADEQALIGEALERIRVELVAPNGRRYIVPGEAKIGWNWGNQVTPADVEKARAAGKRIPRLNPEGLAKFTPGKRDERKRATGLQRVML